MTDTPIPAPRLSDEQLAQASKLEHVWDIFQMAVDELIARRASDKSHNNQPGDEFHVIGSGYECGFDAGYDKGFADGMDQSAGDPRVERIEAGFQAIHAATNGEYSREDMIVMDALQAARDFAVRLARREEHIKQLIEERLRQGKELAAREKIIEVYEAQLARQEAR